MVTTQPLSWTLPTTARVYVLQPLYPGQIERFLLQQWSAVGPIASLTEGQYRAAIGRYLATVVRTSGATGAPDPRLVILCNPMEACLAAELLAQGEMPDPFRLVEQRYRAMARSFAEKNGREFPLTPFAERVYEWRKSEHTDIDVSQFEVEAVELVEHRLMLQRTEKIPSAHGSEERTRWIFRHDRIMEFFLLPAFIGATHRQRRMDSVDDERFWGVYELLGVYLPHAEEHELYALLNARAAETNQNELRNRYEVGRRRRGRGPTPGVDRGSTGQPETTSSSILSEP